MMENLGQVIYSELPYLTTMTDGNPCCNECEHIHTYIIHFVPKNISMQEDLTEKKSIDKPGDDRSSINGTVLPKITEIIGYQDVCKLNLNMKHCVKCQYFNLGIGTMEAVYACKFRDRELDDAEKKQNEIEKKRIQEKLDEYNRKRYTRT